VQTISGGHAFSTQIHTSGTQIVLSNGTAADTIIRDYGFQHVSGGIALYTVISNGIQDVYRDGFAASTYISDGGSQFVFSGGSAVATVVYSGGAQVISSGGYATTTVVSTGGTFSAANGALFAGYNAIRDGGILSAATFVMASGATLEIQRNSAATQATIISGAGGFVKTGSGTLSLTGANAYTGATVISQGTLQGNIGSGNLMVASGATYDGAGSARFVAGLSGWGTIKKTNGLTATSGSFAGSIDATNSGGLTKTGSGTLTLTGMNAYSGGTFIAEGTLKGNIAAGDLTVSGGGTYDGWNASVAIAGLFGDVGATILNTSGFYVSSGSFAGSIDATNAGLTKVGAGTLTLGGSNGFTGLLSIQGGTLALGTSGYLATTELTMWGGTTFNLSPSIAYAGTPKAIRTLSVDLYRGTAGAAATVVGDVTLGGTSSTSYGFISFTAPSAVSSGQTFLSIDGDVTAQNATVRLNFPSGTSGFTAGQKLVLVDVQDGHSGSYDLATLTLQVEGGGATFTLQTDPGDPDDLIAVYAGSSSSSSGGAGIVIYGGGTMTAKNATLNGSSANIGFATTIRIEAGGMLKLSQGLVLQGTSTAFGDGTVRVESSLSAGTTITHANGTIQVVGTGGTGQIVGGNFVNAATLRLGDRTVADAQALGGSIAADITNSASMAVEAGTWRLASGRTLTNAATGVLGIGGTLDLTQGDVANAGFVNVDGGTLEIDGGQFLALIDRDAAGSAVPADQKGALGVTGSSGREGIVDVAGDLSIDGAWIKAASASEYEIRGALAFGVGGVLQVTGDLSLMGDAIDLGATGPAATLRTWGDIHVASGGFVVRGNAVIEAVGTGVFLDGGPLTLADSSGGKPKVVLGADGDSAGGVIKTDVSVSTGGIFEVAGGTWGVTSGHGIDVNGSGAMLQVGNAENPAMAAQLDFQTGAGLAVDNGGGIAILDNGTLNMDVNVLSYYNSASQTYSGVPIIVDRAGTLNVSGVGDIYRNSLVELRSSLVSGGGQLGLPDAEIEELKSYVTAGSATYDQLYGGDGALSGLEGVATSGTMGLTVTGVGAGDSIATTVAKVEMQDGVDRLAVSSGTTLLGTSAGSAVNGEFLVATSGGSSAGGVNVVGDAVVTLGDAASQGKKGIVADVSFNDGGSSGGLLNVAGDIVVSGAVTGNTGEGGKGDVVIRDGAKLTADAVGTDSAAVGTVAGHNGTLTAQTVNAGQVVLSDMTTSAGVITATSGTTVAGGSLSAGSLQAGALAVTGSGTQVNVSGSVTADIAMDGGRLTAGTVQAGELAVSGTQTSMVVSGQVTAGRADIAGGTLKAAGVQANALNLTNANASVSGSVDVTSGTANVSGGTLSAGALNARRLDATGAAISANSVGVGEEGATLTGGTLNASSVKLEGDTVLGNGLQADIGTLEAGGRTVEVGQGSDLQGTDVRMADLKLQGGMLLLDPAWGADSTRATIVGSSFSGTPNTDDIVYKADGSIGVGRNSYLAVGTADKNLLPNLVTSAYGKGLTQDGITAALGIFGKMAIDGDHAALVVDGSKFNASNDVEGTLGTYVGERSASTLTFADGSLLAVSAEIANGSPAITILANEKDPAVFLADSAKLLVTDLQPNKTYNLKIVGQAESIGAAASDVLYYRLDEDTENDVLLDSSLGTVGWVGNNLATDNFLIKLNGSFKDGVLTITTAGNSVADIMPDLDPGLRDAMFGNSPFIKRALTSLTPAEATKVIESAARTITQAAAPQMALLVADAAGAASAQRITLGGSSNSTLLAQNLDGSVNRDTGDLRKNGAALWIMPLYKSQRVWDMPAGNFKADWQADTAGIALGADFTVASMFRAGLSFHAGGGYAKGEGDLASTKNKTNFWGVGTYAGLALGNGLLSFDASYTRNHNDITQDVAAGWGQIKGDLVTHVLAGGVRAEYKFETKGVDIIPHAGVRYTHIYSEDYDMHLNGEHLLKGKESRQDIWTFPVGLTLSKDVAMGNGWYLKPSVDFTVIPATGDIYSKPIVKFAGVNEWSALTDGAKLMDPISYQGTLGLEVGNDTVKIGLNYGVTASQHSMSHAGQLTIRIEF
jgi:autotransporter-associated beta strand protein/autotransporter passenger strand-loop-strand repeat protein